MVLKGHFRVHLRREQVVENDTFGDNLRVNFSMLSGTALNEHSDDFGCQNDSKMRSKIDATTEIVKSSDWLLLTTLWNDFDLSKVIKNRCRIGQEKQLMICRHQINFFPN